MGKDIFMYDVEVLWQQKRGIKKVVFTNFKQNRSKYGGPIQVISVAKDLFELNKDEKSKVFAMGQLGTSMKMTNFRFTRMSNAKKIGTSLYHTEETA